MSALILLACLGALGCGRRGGPGAEPAPAPMPTAPESGSFDQAEIFVAQVDGMLDTMTASSGTIETEGATYAWSAWIQGELLHVREDLTRPDDSGPPVTCQTQAWLEKGTLRYWKERCEGPIYTSQVRQQSQTQVTFDAEGHAVSRRLLVDGQPRELSDLGLQGVMLRATALAARARR